MDLGIQIHALPGLKPETLTSMNAFKVLLPALALLQAGPVFAHDTPYKFRGIALGDTLVHVESTLPQKFDLARVENLAGDMVAAYAGDKTGISRGNCPISAKPNLRSDCLRTMVVLRSIDDTLQVLQITVEQSFATPVALPAFLDRLADSYGKPHAVYSTGQQVHSDGFQERTYLWGGKRLPAKDFSMSSIPFEDAKRLGGQYTAVRVVLNGDAVIGYGLRIADAEKSLRLNRKFEAEQKAKASRSGTTDLEGLKF